MLLKHEKRKEKLQEHTEEWYINKIMTENRII